ncbi:hypothetical protein YDYSG_14400 [Paenibacillus tyrfis]|nr:hypothetical protein YDYSG_14400 [Paenibacillus tyrfis]
MVLARRYFSRAVSSFAAARLACTADCRIPVRILPQHVKPEQISEVLSLPLVEPYDDFYDEEQSGFWCGSVYAGFRQPGVVRDGEDMEIYHLSVEKCANGSETVEILNQASNGYEYRALPCGMRKS